MSFMTVSVIIPIINDEGNWRDYLNHRRSSVCWQWVQWDNIRHIMTFRYAGLNSLSKTLSISLHIIIYWWEKRIFLMILIWSESKSSLVYISAITVMGDSYFVCINWRCFLICNKFTDSVFSLQINFIIFINVIRILVHKLKSQDGGGSHSSHFV